VVVELPAVDVPLRRRKLPLAGLRELLTTLFLHGLAGNGREWDALQDRVPALAPDLRPSGTRGAYVADVVELIGSERVALIGQSLGGHTAFLVAARHPAMVDRLVVIETSPERDENAPETIRRFLTENPAPYGTSIDPAAGAAAVQELSERDYWDEWTRIRCPTLIVRGEHGHLPAEIAARMATTIQNAKVVEIPEAGHDVHLDKPDELADLLATYMSSIPRTS
jgi:pimeloyl-ACP methyl ester carboxylesterase